MPKQGFFILFIIFLLFNNYLWPAFFLLDVTYTVHNESVASFFELKPSEPFVELFNFGMLEFIICCLQALVANIVGSKLITPQYKE